LHNPNYEASIGDSSVSAPAGAICQVQCRETRASVTGRVAFLLRLSSCGHVTTKRNEIGWICIALHARTFELCFDLQELVFEPFLAKENRVTLLFHLIINDLRISLLEKYPCILLSSQVRSRTLLRRRQRTKCYSASGFHAPRTLSSFDRLRLLRIASSILVSPAPPMTNCHQLIICLQRRMNMRLEPPGEFHDYHL
jgi:hypothetical protein